ncbi:SMI1/KNR4 family protein [Mucilaginibacter sp. CAU 1740]|uniref:SMI1/KNR4 family protein n=1 Tax=Mucilaginibacter sp. CAU 1740 TaxID=3140365 RepID=UPI00325C12F7
MWIDKAQERLRAIFPPSYIWWLKNYGGGDVLGDEIYSIYELDFDTVVGGDIVYMNELRRKDPSDNNRLVIQVTGHSEVFYFDLSAKNSSLEYPVFKEYIDCNVIYAESFLDFLKRRILDAE